MSKDFDFTTEYILDKPFFEECYDQTSRPTKFPQAYFKALFFLVFGVIVIKFELLPSSYVGWFFIILCVIEVLSVYFKRTWWVWRQTYSTGSNSKVALQVNSRGVNYNSLANSRSIAWCDIDQLQQSDLGFIFHIGKQRQYISKSCLNDEATAFIVDKHAASK